MILKRLKSILEGIAYLELKGDTQMEIRDLQLDSRAVKTGDLFFAIRGSIMDGHKFIDMAIAQGATAIICEELPDLVNPEVTYVKVKNTSRVVGKICRSFFNDPSSAFQLVGITGTNGKTTCATLLFDCFTALGFKVGLISTVESRIVEKVLQSERTTPDAISLHRLLVRMKEAECAYVFMEVSSHAIDQGRIEGLDFNIGVFTNISRDHLDYHKSFKSYIKAKKKFFDNLCPEAIALTNLDDSNGAVMLQNTKALKKGFSIKRLADYKGKIVSNTIQGLHLEFNGIDFHARLIGEFNAYNLLTAYAVSQLLDQDSIQVLQTLSQVFPAEGRFDVLSSEQSGITAIIDYAHTPDALDKVLKTISKMQLPKHKIITVFGCGGDRDKGKRPEMARIAVLHSQIVILTSDNPRSENPEDILNDMEKGIDASSTKAKWIRIADRSEAIKTALLMAESGDIVLVAGKGHEKYQEVNGVKHPFDDKEKIRALINA